MFNKKSAMALVLSGAVLISAAGCGSSASSTASSAPAQSAASQPASSQSSAASGQTARPEGYPSKDITWIMPFAPGGTNDVWFRLLAEKVQEMEGWK